MSILEERGLPLGAFGHGPCERSSTCFSCRRRSPEGELLAEDGPVAETDQRPGATPRFYEQEPEKQERSGHKQNRPRSAGPSLASHPALWREGGGEGGRGEGGTHQPAALATQAGILKPGPHVLVGADNERAHHQDLLPVLHDALAALEHSGVTISCVFCHRLIPDRLQQSPP